MKAVVLFGLLIGVFFSSVSVRAEGRCPAGYYPVDTPGVLGCAPIPGYESNQQQSAPPPQWADRWGAVYTDPTKGAVGTSSNMLSRQASEQAALVDCQTKGGINCKRETWYRNGCVSMVLDPGGYNVRVRDTLNEAVQAGINACKNEGTNDCHLYYSACSFPVQIQ